MAVLLDVQDPSDGEFRDAYARGSSGSMFGTSDSLLRHLEMERRQKYRVDVMAQLRTEWKLEIKEGAKKLADTGGEE